jgi:ribosome-binding protein aMBF1 (putative translation factor)
MIHKSFITPDQVRVGRLLLGWSREQIAARCEIGAHVIASFEDSGRVVSSRARSEADRLERLATIRGVLEAAGVQFNPTLVSGAPSSP